MRIDDEKVATQYRDSFKGAFLKSRDLFFFAA
jgi:hypothetical protein